MKLPANPARTAYRLAWRLRRGAPVHSDYFEDQADALTALAGLLRGRRVPGPGGKPLNAATQTESGEWRTAPLIADEGGAARIWHGPALILAYGPRGIVHFVSKAEFDRALRLAGRRLAAEGKRA